jgi:hypothetical protein
MKRMRVAGAALAVSFSTLLGCSSDDTVVAANVTSSNDTQYSGITGPDGRDGGFLIPGIPDRILHPGSTSDELQTCKTVRITLSQMDQAPVTHTTIPAQNHWQVDKLDAQGNPIPKTDGMGNEKEDRAGIAQYYERFTVNGWHDGKATILAEALDAADKVLLTATADVDVMENRAVYGLADLQIQPPAMPPGSGGSGSGGASASGGASSMGGAESGGSSSGGASSEGGSGT